MGFFCKSEKINASELSDRIKPIFITAHDICREFGFEEGQYNNYKYEDSLISIHHSGIQNCISVDAFAPGKVLCIYYKGSCVFDCTIKLNGDIKSKVFETGEWTRYFSLLAETRERTISARNLLSTLYEFGGNHLFAIGRDRRVPGANSYGYSFSNEEISITYDLYGGWSFEDHEMKVRFERDEKKNIASAAVITYMGEIVFNATHFFPSNQRPFSSNTNCKVYKKGNWEKHLTDALNNVKALHMEFSGSLCLLKKEESGRNLPVFTGYKPFLRGLNKDTRGLITFAKEDSKLDMLRPGNKAIVHVELDEPTAVAPGMVFSVHEGDSVTIAKLTVTSIED